MSFGIENFLRIPCDELNIWFLEVFANSLDGIAFIGSDYKILYANKQISQMAGVSLETAIGKAGDQVVPGWSRQLGYIYEEVRRTGKPLKSEGVGFYFESQPERGLTYWESIVVPVYGKDSAFYGWILMLREITELIKNEIERKALTDKLQQERNQLSAVFESMEDAVVMCDPAGIILKVNGAAIKMLGFSNEKECSDYWAQHHQDFNFIDFKGRRLSVKDQPFRRVIQEGNLLNYEIGYQRARTGEIRYISFNGTLIKDANGYPMLVVLTGRDITEREQLLRRMEEEQTRFQAILEQMPSGVVIAEAPSGKLISTNKQYNEINKCAAVPVELRARFSLIKRFHNNGQPYTLEQFPIYRSIHNGEIVSNEEMMIERKDGEFGVILQNSAPIYDRDGKIIAGVVVFTDITDLKYAMTQAALANQLQQIIEFLPDGTFVVDQNRKVIAWNRAIEILTGIPKKDTIGTDIYLKVFNVFDQQTLIDIFLNGMDNVEDTNKQTGYVLAKEIFVPSLNHRENVYLEMKATSLRNEYGEKIGVIESIHDITEKRKIELELLKTSQYLFAVLDTIDTLVIVMNPQGLIVNFNRACEKLTGYPAADVKGKCFWDILILPEEIEGLKSKFQTIPESDAFIKNEYGLITKEGEHHLISWTYASLQNYDGPAGYIIGTGTDITDKHKTEQELLKAAKLESLGILAGGIAHDFNNILAAILANLQLATIKLQKRLDISKHLEDTIETTRKASDLTKQLLTFAKGGAPVLKPASISNLVRESVQFALSGSNVKAEFHLPQDLWVVEIDEGQITQVLNNLTINAEQAMPDGGIFEIFGENICFKTAGKYRPGYYIKLILKDHGWGISKEIIPKIFDPFFTTKKTGNGLGLSTSYSIIKKHNGYIEVESALGMGTAFQIYLPASFREVYATQAKMEIAAGGEAKILLMDDEDAIRNVGGEILTYFGYRVTLARDGRETIEHYQKARETGEPFDAVIIDLTVPGGLGGVETIAILRQIDPQIKAIVSSGYANDPVMSDYEHYGFHGVVSKPYKFDELNEVLNRLLDKKQLALDLTF